MRDCMMCWDSELGRIKSPWCDWHNAWAKFWEDLCKWVWYFGAK